MRRRSVLVTLLILGTTLGVVAGGLGVLLKREPAFYTAALETNGPDDPVIAAEVVTRFGDLMNDIRNKPEWGATFAADELNALFRESLCPGGSFAKSLPGHVHAPRVSVDGDRVRLAARYGEGFRSTVVSVELRAWLVANETNTLAVELCGMWAGGLPLGVQSLLDDISEAARGRNVTVTWYRHDGHPVGLFRLYADQVRPTTQVRRLKIEDGRLTVAGKSLLDLTATAPPPPSPAAE